MDEKQLEFDAYIHTSIFICIHIPVGNALCTYLQRRQAAAHSSHDRCTVNLRIFCTACDSPPSRSFLGVRKKVSRRKRSHKSGTTVHNIEIHHQNDATDSSILPPSPLFRLYGPSLLSQGISICSPGGYRARNWLGH